MNKPQLKFLVTGAITVALCTFFIFITAKDNLFVALDDYAYVVNNPHIRVFNWDTIVWSFTSFYEGNWHPLTMISLACDRFIWGLEPFGFHLTNILLHSCTVFFSCLLFFQLLYKTSHFRHSSRSYLSSKHDCIGILTGPCARDVAIGSFAAAVMFGIHPLRVESVVWASERKDVLCMLFIVLSLWNYLKYKDKRGVGSEKSALQYREFCFAILSALLAQLSKPTAVSLPFILLIIDWYPLNKIPDKRSFIYSLTEKTPFFIVAAIGACSTYFAQQIAMEYAPEVGLLSRILVACKALLFYLVTTIWPSGLTAFYMHPGNVAEFAFTEYMFYFFIVVLITFVAIWIGSKQRVWLALWAYYVITLLPMLGLIQVGGQWVADRYSYLPALGLALIYGAVVTCLFRKTRVPGKSVVSKVILVLIGCQLIFYAVQTVRQIRVWHSTETLATRIINNTPHLSGAPYLARAIYRNETGRHIQALEDVGEAMKIALRRELTRSYSETAFVQAVILKSLGRYTEALTIMDWGIEVSVGPPPNDALKLRSELFRLAAGVK